MLVMKAQLIRELFSLLLADPSLGSRKIAHQLGNVARTTVDKYRKLAADQGLSPAELSSMCDDQLIEIFKLSNKFRKKAFKQPDWAEVREYLTTPRAWGCRMNTEANAWKYLYVLRFWPDYTDGSELPEDCMSLRSFSRYYLEYLSSMGMQFCKHLPSALGSFGPASMMEIDTIGDKIVFFDTQKNQTRTAVIFTAVSKFSGLIFAKAMPSSEGHCWAQAIIDAFWFYGGLFQVCRMDNDSAITLHGKKYGGGIRYSRLRPSVHYLFKELDVDTDLCPKNSPRWKGSCENSNGIIQKELFADTVKYPQPLRVSGFVEFNEVLMQEVERINLKPRANSTISRRALFDNYEKQHLLPLPMLKPTARYISMGTVAKDGYLRYLKNYYYAGADNVGKQLLVENIHGEHIALMHETTLKIIVVYELDHSVLPPYHYYKSEQFKTEKELKMTRDKDWFISNISALTGPHDSILKLVEIIWKRLSKAEPTATRRCNQLWTLCEKNPKDLDALNEACAFLIKGRDYSDFRHILRQTFEVFLEMKKRGQLNAAASETSAAAATSAATTEVTAQTSNHSLENFVLHGVGYYAQFNK